MHKPPMDTLNAQCTSVERGALCVLQVLTYPLQLFPAMQALEHCDYDGTLGKLSDEQLSRMRAANRELQLLELFLLAGRLSLTMLPRYLKAMDVHVNLTERLQLEGGAELKAAGAAFRSQLKVWQTVQADARDMAHKLDSWQG